MEDHQVYKCKDGRYRIYNKNTKKITSYPRFIMEQHLGRPLEENEDVHHIDGDYGNNDVSNLAVIKHGEHQRMHSQKYFDKDMICPWCGKTFTWTAKSQKYFYSKLSRTNNETIRVGEPFCSKHCSGCYIRNEQLKGAYNK